MAREKRFVFRISSDESSRLERLATLLQKTQSDVIRCLIHTADTQQKNSPVAPSLAANATGDVPNRSYLLETSSHAAKSTTPA
jgi:hypothetical protein